MFVFYNRRQWKRIQATEDMPFWASSVCHTCVPCAAPDGTPVSPSCVQSVVSLPEIHLHAQPGGQSEEEEEEEGEGEAASSAKRKGTNSRRARRAIISPPSVWLLFLNIGCVNNVS